MPLSTQWPHHPTKLSDLIDHETLTVIVSGACARLGRALTVLDYDRQSGVVTRIDPLETRQNFEPFCQLLRTETRVAGGNAACERCDAQRAHQVVKQIVGQRCSQTEGYPCHMGLTDFSQVLCVDDAPVGVVLAGQFATPEQKEIVRRRVGRIVAGEHREITLLDPGAGDELMRLAAQIKSPRADFAERFRREVENLQQIATAHYHHQKAEYETRFLDRLRSARRFSTVTTLQPIRANAEQLLQIVQQYCGTRYLLLFCNVGEKDTVLTPLAQVGLSGGHDGEPPGLPHFNWAKAGLPRHESEEGYWCIPGGAPELSRGVRGDRAGALRDAACAIALVLGDAFRMVMLFGPYEQPVNPERERGFLFEVSRIISWSVFLQLQSLRLYEERERLVATTQLLQHRFKTALTPIATHIGRAKMQMTNRQYDASLRPVIEQMKAAHELSLQLGRSVRDTVRSAVVMIERDDLKFELYPLSVLVANCAEGFVARAAERSRELVIDPSVELLPYAEVDIARLTIAISNLLDNAVKYSFPTTRIQVKALLDTAEQRHAAIVVQDLGDPIPPNEIETIFERGRRALAEAKMGKIPGTGYGLWEARAIVEAHGGTISARSVETSVYMRQGRAYRVSFLVRIPLRQERA